MVMPDLTRRRLLKLVGGSSALALMGLPIMSLAAFKARVVSLRYLATGAPPWPST